MHTLKTTVMVTLVGISTFGAVPVQAEGLYLGFGNTQDDGVYLGSRERMFLPDRYGDEYRDDYRDKYRDDYRDEVRRSERRCTPERALYKAQRMGIHRARIADVSRRTIDIVGRQHGDRVLVTFARAPRCPVIG